MTSTEKATIILWVALYLSSEESQYNQNITEMKSLTANVAKCLNCLDGI